MSRDSLEDVIRSAGSPLELLQGLEKGAFGFPRVPDEHTHWIEEQRAWRESCSFADQSHHMTDLWIEGPDALALVSDLAVNSFEGFVPGKAKQLVVANPDGYFIGDGILFALGENDFVLVGPPQAPNWVQYHAETGDYDVSLERDDTSGVRDGPPVNFRYQVQGPHAIDVMETVVDGSLPEIAFFNFEEVTIDGNPVNLLRHGMAGEPGFEFWGPHEYGDAVQEAVLDAGEEYDIRRLGALSYRSSAVVSGWVGMPLAAVYDSDEMREYREWVSGRSIEAHYSMAGSFDADDITDYYLTPIELGYGRFVDFDHDFVGKEALQAEAENPERTLVTLEWNPEDVVDVYASLFADGETNRFMDFPIPWRSAAHYDEVSSDGEHVGVSLWAAYTYNERAMLSLAVVDTEYGEPGTEVTVTWGGGGSEGSAIERHEATHVQATVETVPYTEDRR